jgi:hypothetical protein
MKRLLALAISLAALSGCEVHTYSGIDCWYDSSGDYWCSDGFITWLEHENTPATTTVVYVTEQKGGGSNNNIIVIEEEALSYCEEEPPFFHEPDWCTVGEETCCTWSAAPWGVWETYCYIDHCGWELVLVEEDYSYY